MALALEPQPLTGQARDPNSAPEPIPGGLVVAPALGRFWRLFRLSIWRAFEHDAFGTAKASAYSSIFTFFPALLVLGAVLVCGVGCLGATGATGASAASAATGSTAATPPASTAS